MSVADVLPEGFSDFTDPFLLERGMIDMVVDRRQLKATIVEALQFMAPPPAAAS